MFRVLWHLLTNQSASFHLKQFMSPDWMFRVVWRLLTNQSASFNLKPVYVTWLGVPSNMTSFNQSKCFILSKICLWHCLTFFLFFSADARGILGNWELRKSSPSSFRAPVFAPVENSNRPHKKVSAGKGHRTRDQWFSKKDLYHGSQWQI